MRVLQNTKTWPVGGVSFGPGGRTLIAGGSGGYDVWDLAAATQEFIPSHSTRYFCGVAYDPLGQWFYVADCRGGFRALPLGRHQAPPIPGSPYDRHALTFGVTPVSGRLVLSRGAWMSNRVECYRSTSAGLLAPVWLLRDGVLADPDMIYTPEQAKWCTNAIATDRDDRIIALSESRWSYSSGHTPLLVLRNTMTSQVIAELGRLETIYKPLLSVSTAAQGVFAMNEQLLERWDTVSGKMTRRALSPGRAHFKAPAAHPSGRVVVTVSGDGQVRTWDAADLTLLRAQKCEIGKLHSVAFSPDGTLAAAGGEKGQVFVWDFAV